MTYKAKFLRLVVQGSLYGAETFAFSMSLVQNTLKPPYSVPTSVPTGLISAVTNLWAGTALIASAAHVETIKLNEIGLDGKYTQPTTVQYDYPTPLAGTGSLAFPPQVAMAVTLDTGLRRGRAHQGRFYLPLPAMSVATSGFISVADQNAAALTIKNFLTAVQNNVPGVQVGVTSSLGTGEQNTVTAFRLGRVMDTIRSRRTSLPEGYLVTPVPSPT